MAMREALWFLASLAGAAIMTALAIMVAPDSPFWRDLLWGGVYVFIVCAVLILLDMLQPLRERARVLPLIGMVVFGIAFIGCAAAYFLGSSAAIKPPTVPAAREDRTPPRVPDALLAAQIEEMRNIERLLTTSQDPIPTYGDSEENVRRVFDLNALVSNNIRLIKRQADPSSVSKNESDALDAYFLGSIFLADLRYMNTTVDPVSKAYQFGFIPGKIGGIRLPKRYLDPVNRLRQFELSIQLPSSIIAQLKDLEATLSDDMNIFIETVNDQLQIDPRRVLFDQDGKSPYLGATTNEYWRRFKPLKPKVDAIIASVKSYLNTAP